MHGQQNIKNPSKAYSGTRAPAPVVLGNEADDADDPPQFKRECLLLKFVISYLL
jgi:hypothetical protein